MPRVSRGERKLMHKMSGFLFHIWANFETRWSAHKSENLIDRVELEHGYGPIFRRDAAKMREAAKKSGREEASHVERTTRDIFFTAWSRRARQWEAMHARFRDRYISRCVVCRCLREGEAKRGKELETPTVEQSTREGIVYALCRKMKMLLKWKFLFRSGKLGARVRPGQYAPASRGDIVGFIWRSLAPLVEKFVISFIAKDVYSTTWILTTPILRNQDENLS